MFFAVFLALQGVTPIGGGVGGALTGAVVCWNATSGVWAIVEAVKCALGGGIIGAGLNAFAVPLGIVIDYALSIVFGTPLILMLAMSGMFYPGAIIKGFLGESIPILNFLPFWSIMVHVCITRKKQESGESVGLMSSLLLLTTQTPAQRVSSATAVAERVGGRLSTQRYNEVSESQPAPTRERVPLKNFSDIRPSQKPDDTYQNYANAA